MVHVNPPHQPPLSANVPSTIICDRLDNRQIDGQTHGQTERQKEGRWPALMSFMGMCAERRTDKCWQTDRQIDRRYTYMCVSACVMCVWADVRPGCVFLQWKMRGREQEAALRETDGPPCCGHVHTNSHTHTHSEWHTAVQPARQHIRERLRKTQKNT